MTGHITSWRRSDGTRQARMTIHLHGQLVACAGCGTTAWAASADGPVLARWTVEHWPDCCWCPTCRPQPREPQPPAIVEPMPAPVIAPEPADERPACPRCGHHITSAHGHTADGRQVFLCRPCNRHFTVGAGKPRGYDASVRAEAVRLVRGGMTYTDAAQAVGVSKDAVRLWTLKEVPAT